MNVKDLDKSTITLPKQEVKAYRYVYICDENNNVIINIYDSMLQQISKSFINKEDHRTYKYESKTWSIGCIRNMSGLIEAYWYKNEDQDDIHYINHSKLIYDLVDTRHIKDTQGFMYSVHDLMSRHNHKELAEKYKPVDKVFNRLKPIKDSVKKWVDRVASSEINHMIVSGKRNKKSGVCTYCGSQVTLSNVKHNEKVTCPSCNTTVIVKSSGIEKRSLPKTYEIPFVFNEKVGNVDVLRYHIALKTINGIKVSYSYVEDYRDVFYPDGKCHEYEKRDGVLGRRYYKGIRASNLYYTSRLCKYDNAVFYSNWISNYNRESFIGRISDTFKSDTFKKLNIPKLSLIYCIQQIPHFQQLINQGYYQISLDYWNNRKGSFNSSFDSVNRKATSLREAFQLTKPQLRFVKEHNFNLEFTQIYSTWLANSEGLSDLEILDLFNEYNSEKELSTYNHDSWYKNIQRKELINSFKLTFGRPSYVNLRKYIKQQRTTLREFDFKMYFDYLKDAKQLKYDLSSKEVLLPKRLKKTHDDAAVEVFRTEMQELREKAAKLNSQIEDISIQFNELTHDENKYDDLVFIVPKTADDFLEEGAKQEICVGKMSFINNHINKKSIILFVRHIDAIDEPLYTLEYKNGKIVQLRGFNNRKVNDEDQNKVIEWLASSNINQLAA